MLLVLLLAGCAVTVPVVDYPASAPGLTPDTYRSDLAECREYAEDTDLAPEISTGTPGGSSTMGYPGLGGSSGNAHGISSGPSESPLTSQEPRNEAINRCLAARGYTLAR
jgi:hypothetical protein